MVVYVLDEVVIDQFTKILNVKMLNANSKLMVSVISIMYWV